MKNQELDLFFEPIKLSTEESSYPQTFPQKGKIRISYPQKDQLSTEVSTVFLSYPQTFPQSNVKKGEWEERSEINRIAEKPELLG